MASGVILVEAETRWDAADLAHRLARHHSYLVQLGNRRWHVCVPSDDERAADELLASVRAEARVWAGERCLETVLHVDGRDYEVPG